MTRSLLLLIFLCLSTSAAYAQVGEREQDAVYDADDRREYFESATELKRLSRQSVVALMSGYRINHDVPNGYHAPTLQKAASLCSDEPYGPQPIAAFCSGVLIAPDLVLTAGHCFWDEELQCQRTRLIFDYHYESKGQLARHDQENVYSCREVVTNVELSGKDGVRDWAIIQLDRAVDGQRAPTKLRSHYRAGSNGQPQAMRNGESLLMMGFPVGLPLKIDTGGIVTNPRSTLLDAFVTTVDAFGGNSGSGVWHKDTQGEWALAGILVSGDKDFVASSENGKSCQRSNQCSASTCLGENVVYLDRPIADFCVERNGRRIHHELCGDTSAQCGDGFCDIRERGNQGYCELDCGPRAELSVCGDNYCSIEEYASCPDDCILRKPASDSCEAQNYGTFNSCQTCPTRDPDCDLKESSNSGGFGDLFNCQSVDPANTGAFGVISMLAFAGLIVLARRRKEGRAR